VLLLRVASLERGSGDEGKLLDLDGCGRGDRMLSWDVLRLSGLVGAIGDKSPFFHVLRLSVLDGGSGERMLSADGLCFRLVDLIGIVGEGGAERTLSPSASSLRVLNGGKEKKVLSREVVCSRLVDLTGGGRERVLSLGRLRLSDSGLEGLEGRIGENDVLCRRLVGVSGKSGEIRLCLAVPWVRVRVAGLGGASEGRALSLATK
jgi:hypothetical protein